MRHPTSGLSEDDLSRLTGSSTTSSTPSHDSNNSNSCSILPIINDNNETTNNLKNIQHFNSTYLPEIIDPLEWQKSRKRKERQDSTSSTTQDRKLVRSNSEEFLPNADYEVIRRVSSHEDFKIPLQEINDDNILRTIQENEIAKKHQNHLKDNTAVITDRSRLDTTSPARSHRLSPSREYRSGKYKENDDTDCEHERRRSSERFSKTRAPPGRKAGTLKKSTRHINSRLRERDENVYKYDISAMKHERRGFVSKFKLEERARKEEAADGEKITTNDYNDNNLIDFHIRRDYKNNSMITQHQQQQKQQITTSSGSTTTTTITTTSTSNNIPNNSHQNETIAEALPWDCSIQEDQTPVLCRRFAEVDEYPTNDDQHSSKLSKIGILQPPSVIANESSKLFHAFETIENLKTREVMQNVGLFQTPDERLKQINKKLTALKKRVTQLEENYERTYGYRPSQVEKFNDKHIKNVIAEISKLRKEKHELKSDPMSVLGLKVSGGMDAEKKLKKMHETLTEIEMKLTEKRQEGNRPENLDDLTSDQLVQEKTAVQHSLLYLESLYGRPNTREERDAARPLYDRYRIIKRMVAVKVIGSGLGGAPELPTILEHEAMAFTGESVQCQSVVSTDTPTSPELSATISTGLMPFASISPVNFGNSPPPLTSAPLTAASSIESPSENSGPTTDSTDTSANSTVPSENIHTLSIDELWKQLEKVRDEKKLLKRSIKEFEAIFEQQNGRRMLKTDRKTIEETYAQYKQKKAKFRLLQALIKKHISN